MADNQVRLVFKITDDGSLAVFDRAGVKIREVKGAAEGLSTTAVAAGGNISKMGLALGGALVAGALAARQALAGVVSTLQEMDNIGETAKRVGLTTTQLSSLRLAAQQGGVSLESLARSSGFLARQIVASENATSKQARLFKELGVDTSQGLLPTLVQLGKVFDQLPDGPTKTATAMALLGREGAQPLNILNGTLEESIRLNGELGRTIDEETATAAGRAADAIDEMSASLGGLAEAVSARAAGPLTALAGLITDVSQAAQGLLRDGVQLGANSQAIVGLLGGGVAPESGAPPVGIVPPDYSLPPNAGPSIPPSTARIRDILSTGRDGKRGTGGGRGGGRGPDPGKLLADATAAADRDLEAREQAIVGLLEAQATLRDEAVRRAEEQLRIAQQTGASAADQLALAGQIDAAERAKLLVVKEQLETQLMMRDLPPAPDQVAEVAALQAELQIVNQRLAEAPTHVAALTRELQNAATAGDTLNESFARAIDSLLNRGGEFDVGTLLKDVLQIDGATLLGDLVGDVSKSLGLEGNNLAEIIGNGLSELFGTVGEGFQSLFGAAGGGPGGSVSSFSNVIAGGSSTAPAAAGGGTGGFGGLAGGAGAAAGYAAIAVAVIGGITQAIESVQSVRDKPFYTDEDQAQALAGGFTEGAFDAIGFGVIGKPLGKLLRSLPMEALQVGTAINDPILGSVIAALLPAILQAPTRGTFIKKELNESLNGIAFPRQREFEAGGRTGLRLPSIEQSATQDIADYFAERGFDRSGVMQEDRARLRERVVAGESRVGALRDEALGIGAVAGKTPRDATVIANTLLNNLAVLGVSAGEARRQLLKAADALGVTLIGGLDQLNTAFLEGARSADDLKRLQSASQGLVELFGEDLPKGIDLQKIIERRTTASGGIDISGVQGDILRTGIALDLRESVKDIRFGEMNNRQKERELRSRLSRIDSELAATGITDTERQRLLEERAQVGAGFVSLAQSRYGEGSAARRRAIAYGTSIIEDTAATLETFPVAVESQTEATENQTAAAKENTKATNNLTQVLKDGINSKLEIAFSGDEDAAPAVVATIKREFLRWIKSPEGRGAVRDATRAA